MLGETEQNVEELDDSIADLRKNRPSLQVSPRFQPVVEEMFSVKEDQESSDDPTRGLGRWFKVVKPKRIGGSKTWQVDAVGVG